MAKRRARASEGSLDSLLDTMTNVVGILVIILIVTQVNVTEATRRIREGLPEVSEKQLADKEKELDALQENLDDLKDDTKPVTPEDLEKLKMQLAQLKKELEQDKLDRKEAEEMRKRLAELEELMKKLEAELATKGTQLASMAEKIEEAEKIENKPQPVRLPNPRKPEEGFTEISVAVTDSRLYDITLDKLLAKAVDELQKRDDLVVFDSPRYYDRAGLLKALKPYEKSHPTLDFKFTARPDGQILVQVSAKPGKGEPIAALETPDSPIRKALASATLSKNYVRFFVTEDSFETYVTARQRAESFRIPAGWYFADPKVLRQFSLAQVSSPAIRTAPDPDYKPPEKKPGPPAKRPVDLLD